MTTVWFCNSNYINTSIS